MSKKEPTLEEWQRAYTAAIQLRDLAPWNWMYEDQMFAVVNPEDGEVGYCSVMGSGGEFLALSVYLGEEGLLSHERIERLGSEVTEDGSSPVEDPEVFLSQKSLLVSFEGSGDVDKRDRDVFKELGLRFRGKHAWPVLRSYEPGFVPWFLTANECRFLTYAIEQTLVMVKRIKENPGLLEEFPGCILTRRLVNSADAGDSNTEGAEWIDDWPAWPYLEDEGEDVFVYAPGEVDELHLKRVMRGAKPSGAWEVDISYAPFQVAEGERPYFPRLLLCVHHGSGMILSFHVAELHAEGSEFVEQFIQAMEQHQILPEQIVVRRNSVGELLTPIAHVIGADVLLADFLPGVEMARESMQGFMR